MHHNKIRNFSLSFQFHALDRANTTHNGCQKSCMNHEFFVQKKGYIFPTEIDAKQKFRNISVSFQFHALDKANTILLVSIFVTYITFMNHLTNAVKSHVWNMYFSYSASNIFNYHKKLWKSRFQGSPSLLTRLTFKMSRQNAIFRPPFERTYWLRGVKFSYMKRHAWLAWTL
jgi:hypothetical protein